MLPPSRQCTILPGDDVSVDSKWRQDGLSLKIMIKKYRLTIGSRWNITRNYRLLLRTGDFLTQRALEQCGFQHIVLTWYFERKAEHYQLLQANLTMLYSKAGPRRKEKLSYFQSQITDTTPSHTSCRSISPSFCHNQQNQDRSNLKQAAPYFIPKAHSPAPSLREQITKRLQQIKSQKHTASLLYTHQTHDQPLSTIRKMLTQDSPKAAIKVGGNKQQWQDKNRRARRTEFELRQQKLIQMKKQRQELGQFQQLRKDIQECTFRPKLTSYHRL